MGSNKKTILIIVLAVVAILAVVGGVFAYMFLATDTFKSGQELFAKYLMQNVEELNRTINLDKVQQLEEKLKENKYEESLTISSESSETASLFEKITIDTQNDPINKKYYGILGVSNSSFEEPLEIEYMIESDMYSLRFTNAVKQFLTIQNVNLKELAEKLGADEEILDYIPDSIDFESFSTDQIEITEQEKQTMANKYMNLLYGNISGEKYTKSKDVVITLNGKTITTNAYILTLNMQDVKNLVIKFLETLVQDEIILNKLQAIDEKIQDYSEESLKDAFVEELELMIDELSKEEAEETEENIVVTVYEQKGKTIRLKAEQGLSYITLDTMEVDGKTRVELNSTEIGADNIQLSNKITMTRESNDKIKIKVTNIEGEEQQSIDFNTEFIENENDVEINIDINIDESTLSINRNINFVDEIQYDVELDESNNVILNDLSAERITSIFGMIGPKLVEVYAEPIIKIGETIILNGALAAIQNTDLSQAEAAQFNSKFQPYEGTDISTAEVNALLNIVLSHNNQEKVAGTERYIIVTGDVTLSEEDLTVPILEESKYFEVECKMDEDGFINEIVVTEDAISLENT